MRMSSRTLDSCVLLFLLLTSVSAVQRLNSIKDLKKIDFGKSVPKHSLILLHWFANMLHIDNNNIIWLTFDPNTDYGSHHYGNFEGLLDPLPRGYRYFTVGNLNEETSDDLPDYVVNPRGGYAGHNRDRIIIRAWEQRIDQVYMTQHYSVSENQGTPYDPVHTYQVTLSLLRQIREFSVRDNQLPLTYLRHRYGSHPDDVNIRNMWGDLACLGLFLFIVIEEKYSQKQPNNRPENNRRSGNTRPQLSRPEIYRPENYRPENYRPENYRPENYVPGMYPVLTQNYDRTEIYLPENNTMELNNRSQKCSFCKLVTCCFVIIVLVIIIVIISLLFLSK
ncbi:uncharacterized protein [Antennarius striatus]|uniref:uncharacterized protein n=1 Tax=Antennarius striatus TaxID=241820 RepID=UPI0035B2E2A2